MNKLTDSQRRNAYLALKEMTIDMGKNPVIVNNKITGYATTKNFMYAITPIMFLDLKNAVENLKD